MSYFSQATHQLEITISLLKSHALEALIFLGVLWAVQLVNVLTKMRLNALGLRPRQRGGLIGIFTSPFLHGDFNHLFFNSVPFFLLSDFMLVATGTSFWPVTLVIVVFSGLLVWLFGRRGIHVGASTLIMGFWGFLLALAFYHPSISNLILVVIMLYYLGGLVFNLLPAGERVSVEGHIFGAIAGVVTALAWLDKTSYFHWPLSLVR